MDQPETIELTEAKPKVTFQIVGDPAPLFAALAKAQAAYGPIPKTRTVKVVTRDGSYTFDYAPLDVVLGATIPALSANGLCFLQPPSSDGPDGIEIRSILGHSSGARIESVLRISTAYTWEDKHGVTHTGTLPIQKAGAQMTYYRRYSAVGVLGTVADEDTDGDAEGTQSVAARQAPPSPPQNASRPRQEAKPRPADQDDVERAAQRARAASVGVKPEPRDPPPGGDEPVKDTPELQRTAEALKQELAKVEAPAERPASVPPPPPEEPKPRAESPMTEDTQRKVAGLMKAKGYRKNTPEKLAEMVALLKQVTGKESAKLMTEADGRLLIMFLETPQ